MSVNTPERRPSNRSELSAANVSPTARREAGKPLFLGGLAGAALGGLLALPIGMLAMDLPTFRASVASAIVIALLWVIGGAVVGLLLGVVLALFLSGSANGKNNGPAPDPPSNSQL